MKNNNHRVGSIREFNVYRMAFDTAMEIFKISKNFPIEEKYSMTDQIRRSSRSVCTNLAEAWRKKKYMAVFINKITDCSQEAAETQTWLEFAYSCNYIDEKLFNCFDQKYEHIFAMLITMERKAESFCRSLHLTSYVSHLTSYTGDLSCLTPPNSSSSVPVPAVIPRHF